MIESSINLILKNIIYRLSHYCDIFQQNGMVLLLSIFSERIFVNRTKLLFGDMSYWHGNQQIFLDIYCFNWLQDGTMMFGSHLSINPRIETIKSEDMQHLRLHMQQLQITIRRMILKIEIKFECETNDNEYNFKNFDSWHVADNTGINRCWIIFPIVVYP